MYVLLLCNMCYVMCTSNVHIVSFVIPHPRGKTFFYVRAIFVGPRARLQKCYPHTSETNGDAREHTERHTESQTTLYNINRTCHVTAKSNQIISPTYFSRFHVPSGSLRGLRIPRGGRYNINGSTAAHGW